MSFTDEGSDLPLTHTNSELSGHLKILFLRLARTLLS